MAASADDRIIRRRNRGAAAITTVSAVRLVAISGLILGIDGFHCLNRITSVRGCALAESPRRVYNPQAGPLDDFSITLIFPQ